VDPTTLSKEDGGMPRKLVTLAPVLWPKAMLIPVPIKDGAAFLIKPVAKLFATPLLKMGNVGMVLLIKFVGMIPLRFMITSTL
jgi:hypothetical protein